MSTRRSRLSVLVAALGAALSTGCVGGLFSASDSPATLHGTITGVPVASRASASAEASAAAAAVTVTLEQDPSITATVDEDGFFTLTGLPAGGFTLIFRWERQEARLAFSGVEPGQRITITVRLGGGEAVLLEDRRDGDQESTCARGAGFWCQNQHGGNPNMSAAEFQQRAEKAALLLSAVSHLDTATEIAQAVCNTGDQLSRQLATLALNLAAELVDGATALHDESFRGAPLATVDDALAAGIQVANGSLPVSRDERNQIKDVIERINENQNTDSPCGADEDPTDGDDDGDDEDEGDPTDAEMTICHIPPGNPNARHTITIGAAAWPAHRAHGDYEGACK